MFTSQEQPKANTKDSLAKTILAYLLMAVFVLFGIFYGFNLYSYLLLIASFSLIILPLPPIGLALILFFTMIFERFFTLQGVNIGDQFLKIYPLDIIIGLTFFGWLISLIKEKDNRGLFFGWPEKLLLIFIFIAGADFIRSIYNLNSVTEIAFSSLKNYAFYPIIYFLTIYLIKSKEEFKRLFHIMLLAGLLIIVFIGIGIVRGEGLWTEFTPLSTAGSRLLAGTHAFYLALCSLMVFALVVFSRFWNRNAALLILWVWSFGILSSLMRHLWLSLFISLTFLLIFIPKNYYHELKKINLKTAGLIIAFIALLMISTSLFPYNSASIETSGIINSLSNRIQSFASLSGDSSASWRLDLWRTAKDQWLINPIFGIGFGLKIPLELGDFKTFEEIRNLHNSLLAITVQMGLLGLAFLSLLIYSIFRPAIKEIKKDLDLAPYLLGLTACLVLILLSSLFQPYLETNLTGIFLWLILGLMRSGSILNNQESKLKR